MAQVLRVLRPVLEAGHPGKMLGLQRQTRQAEQQQKPQMMCRVEMLLRGPLGCCQGLCLSQWKDDRLTGVAPQPLKQPCRLSCHQAALRDSALKKQRHQPDLLVGLEQGCPSRLSDMLSPVLLLFHLALCRCVCGLPAAYP
jgi:hypothetical protein